MALSLFSLAREAEALAHHATAAKLLAPFAPEAAAQHLKNLKTIHEQIGAMLAVEQQDAAPELLAALKGFMSNSSVVRGLPHTARAARSAIAKAEGRS